MIIDPKSLSEDTNSNYPEELRYWVEGRSKKRLGRVAGLNNFGVNLVTLQPGSYSSIRHWHLKQDEFIYVVLGEIILIDNKGEHLLQIGDCAGFPAGEANGHHLYNKSQEIAQYLEIGDRTPNDIVNYPDIDLLAKASKEGWVFQKK